MIVILMQDVKKLGKEGDVVKVSDGYARNMLLPKGLAKEATDGNVKSLEKQKAIMEEKKAEEREKAKINAEKLSSYTVEIAGKHGDGGKLFGSITSQDIAKELEKQYKIKIDKRKIILESPIKSVGKYEVEIKVYPEISTKIKVDVI